jgi:hypothetical protein
LKYFHFRFWRIFTSDFGLILLPTLAELDKPRNLLFSNIEKLQAVIAQQRSNTAKVSHSSMESFKKIIQNSVVVKYYFPAIITDTEHGYLGDLSKYHKNEWKSKDDITKYIILT